VRKPWVKFLLHRLQGRPPVIWKKPALLKEMEKLALVSSATLAPPATACLRSWIRKSRKEISTATILHAVLSGNRKLRCRIHPYAKQAFPWLAAVGFAYAIAGTVRFDIEKASWPTDQNGNPGYPERHLAKAMKPIDAIVKNPVLSRTSFKRFYTPDVLIWARSKRLKAPFTIGAQKSLHSSPALFGKVALAAERP